MLLLSKTSYSIIFGLSLLAIPAIIYSVYYQLINVKAWCLLCLSVSVILTFQILLTFFAISPQIDISKLYLSLFIVLLSFTAISAIWLFIASKLIQEKQYNILKIESTKFKRNYSVFKNLLHKNKPIETSIANTSEIVFGNSNSSLKLLVITNPFCGFCKEVHELVEEILMKYPEQIFITIRFNINASDTESDLVKVTARLLEIYNIEGEQQCLKAMHAIYNKKEVQDWVKLFGACEKPLQYQEVLLKEQKWCIDKQINFTPELLINGFAYPKAYKKDELLYFIDELQEDNPNTFIQKIKLETI